MTHANTHHVYLLKLWREEGSADWRITVQGMDEADRRGFRSLEELTAWLFAHDADPLGTRPSWSQLKPDQDVY